MKTILWVVLALVLVGILVLLANGNDLLARLGGEEIANNDDGQSVPPPGGQSTSTQGTTTTPGTSTSTREYTLAEVARHATRTDCWFVIDGRVYDVTAFIAGGQHPGGAAIIQGCGKDATSLFNTRPMGSGTPHSDRARSFLPNFQIGVLAR